MIPLSRQSGKSEKRKIYDKSVSAYALLKCCPVYTGVHGERDFPDNGGNGDLVY